VRNESVGARVSGGQSWNVQSGRYKKPARLGYFRGLPRTPMERKKQTNRQTDRQTNPIHRKRVNIKRHVSGTGSIVILRPTKKFKTFPSGNIHRLPSTCYHLHVPIVLKCGSLNFLEPSGPVQTCNGIVLPLPSTCGKLTSLKPATRICIMYGKLRSTESN
jgi:hypothetical protein